MRSFPNLLYALSMSATLLLFVEREATAEAPSAPSPFASLEVIEERLPNGLTLIMSPDHRLPTVAVEVRYLVGSGHEPEGRSGFAHLFEHLMFQGSRSYDHEYFEPFSPIGGKVNGTTNVDRTNYYEQVPAEALELALWMESDRMEGLLETLTEDKLNNQRDVVKNERRQRYENTPYGMVWKLLYEEMFPKGHPYQHTTIGSHEDLTAASMEDVKTFFQTYYAPANAMLTIVGDFDPKEARSLVLRYFGHMKAGARAARPKVPQSTRDTDRLITVKDQVKLPRVYLAWHSPALYAQGDAEMDLLATLLTDGKSSRLYKPLVFESKLAKDVAAFQMSMGLGSLFVVYATAAPGVSVEQLEEALSKHLKEALKTPASEDEFKRALNGWQKSFYHSVEGVMSRAQMLSNYAHLLGTSNGFAADLKRYTGLTPAVVFDETQRWLHDQPLRLHFLPQDDKVGYEPPNRSALPELSEGSEWSPPRVSEWTSANGLKVLHVEQRQAPLITASLILPHGADTDPANKAGLSALTVSMLDEGADGLSALELSDAFQRLATDYSSYVTSTSTTFNLSCLAHQLTPSLKLLTGLLTRPHLAQADLDRLQKQLIAKALSAEADPRSVRNLIMKKVLFGDGYLGLPSSGLPSTLEQVSLADIKAQHKALIQPHGATLIVTGAVDRATLEEALVNSLNGWSSNGAQLTARPLTPAQGAPSVHWVDFPGSSQSAIAVVRTVEGSTGAKSPLADELFNRVFGGDFTSRLNMNLREDKGYTYGAYSALFQNPRAGLWFVGAMVKGETTSASLKEINKELTQIMSAGNLSQAELDRARSGLLKGFPNRFEKISSITSTLSELVSEGRDPSWFKLWGEGLPKVTLEQVLASGARLTPQAGLQVIIAGDLNKHGASVAELGAPVVIYNARGERLGPWTPPSPEPTTPTQANQSQSQN